MIGTTANPRSAEMMHPGIGERVLQLAPQSNISMPRDSEHFVQFYETDAFLLHTLSDYIGTGLAEGMVCLVVATRAHSMELDGRLQAAGIDVRAARASGLYVALDAAETLA